jgi:hypothetical protein
MGTNNLIEINKLCQVSDSETNGQQTARRCLETARTVPVALIRKGAL